MLYYLPNVNYLHTKVNHFPEWAIWTILLGVIMLRVFATNLCFAAGKNKPTLKRG